MKKIAYLLVSFTTIFLSGCTDEKVTNEWLVGNWECTTRNDGDPADKRDRQLASLPNGTLKNSFSTIFTLANRMSFKYQDGKYYFSRSKTTLGKEFDVDKEYNVKNKAKIEGLFYFNETNEIKKLSNDEFKITFEKTTKSRNERSYMDGTTTGVTTCERVE